MFTLVFAVFHKILQSWMQAEAASSAILGEKWVQQGQRPVVSGWQAIW